MHTREIEAPLQGHEHPLAGCDRHLRISVRLHPRYSVYLVGNPLFAFSNMTFSLRERVFSHAAPSLFPRSPAIDLAE
jgi:hypothetical protein